MALAMMTAVAVAAQFVLLYAFRGGLEIFAEAESGKSWLAAHPGARRAFAELTAGNGVDFVLHTVGVTLAVCLVVAAAARFFLVARFLYLSRSTGEKLLLWGLPLAAASGWVLSGKNYRLGLYASMGCCLAPALLLAPRSFSLAHAFLPEATDLLDMGRALLFRTTRRLPSASPGSSGKSFAKKPSAKKSHIPN
ncbi:MAG: hypothetical protein JRI97_07925 [Deltaproteobacteria bacterium]|nr:hypothetical protein [Deltaproteobacteria bacterium]